MTTPEFHPPLAEAELAARKERIRRRLQHSTTVTLTFLAGLVVLTLVALAAAWQARHSAQATRRALQEVETQKLRAESGLARSRLAQAKAFRAGGAVGWRFQSLTALQEAARLLPSQEERNEYVASITRPDFGPARFSNTSPTNRDWMTVAFDSDVRRAAHGTRNGDITLLDLETGAVQHTLPGFGERPLFLSFSADGAWLVAGYDERVRIWDLAAARPLFEFDTPVPIDSVRPADLSRDKKRILVWDENRGLLLFDLGSPPPTRERLVAERFQAFALHPQGQSVAVITGGTCAIKDAENLETSRKFPLPRGEATRSATWSPRGRLLAGCTEHRIWILDTETGRTLDLEGPRRFGVEVLFSEDERTVMAYGWGEGHTLVRDAWTGRDLISTFHGFARRISSAGTRVGHLHFGQSFGVWDWAQPIGYRRWKTGLGASPPFRNLAFKEEWSLVVGAEGADRVCLFDFPSGTLLDTMPAVGNFQMEFRPGTHQLAVGGPGKLRMFEWRQEAARQFSARPLFDVPQPEGARVEPETFSRDGRWLLLTDEARKCWLLDLEAPRALQAVPASESVASMSFSESGDYFAVGLWDRPGVVIRKTRTLEEVARFPLWRPLVRFLPGGSELLVSHLQGCDLFSLSGQHSRTIYRRQDAPNHAGEIAVSGDGRRVAITAGPREVMILDRATWKEWLTLPVEEPRPHRLLLDERGENLLGVGEDVIHHWDLRALERELERAGLGWESLQTNPLRRTLAGATAGLGIVSGSFILPGVFAGMLVAALCALFAFRRQRNLLRNYEEVEELVAERDRALTQAQAEVLQSQKMKALGTLAAGIAHDFNNLLSVIRMANKLTAEQTCDNPDLAENTQLVEQSVAQGKAVIRSMLGYSRAPAERALFNVNETVRETALLLNQQFLRGIHLNLELDAPAPAVHGVRSRLEQILLNLVVNSAEAMAGQGELRLAVRAVVELPAGMLLRPRTAGPWVEVTVADTGPGISPETGRRIFEPFFTTKDTGTAHGAGLGLYMVYAVAEGEGIGLALETQSGQGTCFRILLPLE